MIKRRFSPGYPEKQGILSLLAVVVLIFAVVSPLHSGGKSEKAVMAEADRLIGEKQYNRALALLSDYAAKNPDDFQVAHTRIQKIFEMRNEYNETAERLLAVMIDEPDNNVLILSLSNRLLDLDPERIAETQDFINRVREVALFRANRNRLEGILAQGKEFITEERFADAMEVYISGLDIYQDDFFRAGYGYEVESRTRQGIGEITSGEEDLASLISPLESAVTALEGLADQEISRQRLTALNNAYARAALSLDQLAALRSVFGGVDGYFQEQLELIHQTNPGTADRTFLAFAVRLMEGAADSSGEGMLGVIDTLWNQSADRIGSVVDGRTAAAYAAVYNEAMGQDYGSLSGSLDLLAGYVSLPVNLIERRSGYDQRSPRETVFDAQIPAEQAGGYAFYRSELAAIVRYRDLASAGIRLRSLGGTDTVALWRNGGNGNVLMLQERNLAVSIRQLKTESAGLRQALQEDITAYSEYGRRFGERVLTPLNDAGAALAVLESQFDRQENAALARQYTIANGLVESRIVQRETEFRQSIDMIQGEGARSPSRAVTVLGGLETAVEADLEAVDDLAGRYAGESPEALQSPELSPLYADAAEMSRRLETIRTQSRSFQASARSLVAQAQTYSQEGDRFLADARAALAQDNFDRARERLIRAGERFDSSLDIESSPSVSQIRDVLIPQLDAEIARLENEVVIRDVNELIASARGDFNRGNFDIAEEKLVRAENRWRTTQVVENQEIRNWLNIIQGALSSRSGRTIPSTAPLYSEMSQLLSDARKNFDEGVYYFGQSRRNEGLARFNNAREKTQKVKLMYPLNEDAGLLELRMDREQDPPAFEQGFSTRLQNAIAGTERKDWQSYADLRNLFVLYPNYPGRQAIETRAEIAMGIRPAPPDPAMVAESNRLTSQARAIAASTTANEIELRQAQEYANSALEFNPNNENAARLASEIAVRIGGSGSLFDRETELKYNRAGELLQQNNYVDAYQLALEIADDSRYRNNSRILDLLRRIRAYLD
ncbi:MAG: hypothetical protein LBI67_06200 [Treponema sp.]|nr:hypothetical protein [Treponema sp.]